MSQNTNKTIFHRGFIITIKKCPYNKQHNCPAYEFTLSKGNLILKQRYRYGSCNSDKVLKTIADREIAIFQKKLLDKSKNV